MAMPKAPAVFPREEYLRRMSLVKAEMEKRGVDVSVITVPGNITYLTGYTAQSGYVPQGLVISLKEEEPTFLTRRMDAPAAKHQMWIDNSRAIGIPENTVGLEDKDGFDTVIDFLHDKGFARASLGLELGSLTTNWIQKFTRRIPDAKIVDFSKAVTWIRLIKSDLEIAVMEEAGAIADAAMTRAGEVIRPGVREADAAAEIISVLIKGANGKVGTLVSSFFLCASPRSATPHLPWSEDSFHDGSQVNLEFGGVRHGYTTALMRTFSIGKPSDRLRRVHEGEVEGLEAALAAVKPGATCGDVARAFNSTLKKHGFEKESRCGYAIGIDWLEPTASLQESDTTVLQPNMCFHLMLGNWIDDDFGYVISETFRVTETGVKTFSKLPRIIHEI